MAQKFEVRGLKELEKGLLKLGAETGAKTLRGALRDGAQIYLDDMEANAPELYGDLKKSLGRKTRLNKRGNTSNVAIVRVGAVKKGAWQAEFHEFGTSKQKAKPFIRPAMKKSDDVVRLVKEKLAIRIDKAAKKIAKQARKK